MAEVKPPIKLPSTRERILTIGLTGAGKSYQWLSMAKELLPAGVKFTVIDTDAAINYMLDTQFPELKPEFGGNVTVRQVYTWDQYMQVIKDLQSKPLRPTDWLVIDMADNAWSAVQLYFVSLIFDQSMGDYFLEARKKVAAGKEDVKKKGITAESLDGWMDWPVINRMYDDFILPIIYGMTCNVYSTTKVQELGRQEKDAEILSLYGAMKVKPSGQKNLGHQHNTILLLKPGTDKWYVSTIKDRAGRPYMKDQFMKSLYTQYLVGAAGWPVIE